jgi:hypothetical protein
MPVEGYSDKPSVTQGRVASMTAAWAESSFDLDSFLFSRIALSSGGENFIAAASICDQ